MHLAQEVLGSCRMAHRKLLLRLIIPGGESEQGTTVPLLMQMEGVPELNGDLISQSPTHPGPHQGCPTWPLPCPKAPEDSEMPSQVPPDP